MEILFLIIGIVIGSALNSSGNKSNNVYRVTRPEDIDPNRPIPKPPPAPPSGGKS